MTAVNLTGSGAREAGGDNLETNQVGELHEELLPGLLETAAPPQVFSTTRHQ